MTTGRVISGSRPVPTLMRRVWFNCNRVFSEFGFTFSNPRRVRVLLFPPRPDYIFKIYFLFFIFYFNLNDNNYYNVF